MLVDRGGLWYRVLVARYGEVAGKLEVGGRSVSTWWRELAKIRDGVEGVGGSWFADSVVCKVGKGTNVSFWKDRWLGKVPLCQRFSRLFDLSLYKSSTVAEMFSLGWEEGGAAWRCRIRLWDWEEEMIGECCHLLDNFVLQTDVVDRWHWLHDVARGYTVRGAYYFLTSQEHHLGDGRGDLVWHSHVPLKVSILAWRLLRDRLPTKNNLLRRGILQQTDIQCVMGCSVEETVPHVFFHCSFFGTLWQHMRQWLRVSGADLYTTQDHFLQFTNVLGSSRTRTSFMQLLWLLGVWVIWNERNHKLFNNGQNSMLDLVEKVKCNSLWWLKANNVTFCFRFSKVVVGPTVVPGYRLTIGFDFCTLTACNFVAPS